MISHHAARRFPARVPRPGHGGRGGRVHRRRPGQGGAGRPCRTAKLVDTSHRIDADAQLAIVTDKDADGLEIIRHCTAHLLAYAVKELFPDAQVTIGPVIENGFYYDFAYKRPFTPEDLAAIEKRMAELADEGRAGACAACCRATRPWPTSRAWASTTRPRSSPASRPTRTCRCTAKAASRTCAAARTCRSTGKLQALQADEGGRRLLARRPGATSSCSASTARPGRARTSCSSTCACSRRPRSATTASSAASSTCSTWTNTRPARCSGTPRAGRCGSRSSSTCARVYRDNGYQEVKGPQILDQGLWEKTGHWDKYRENMFTTESEKRDYALKPMNCPGHILIFKQGIKSYRDLPLRYGEFGQCHRNEPTRRRCTASCACAASRRTTATSSAPRT